MAYKNQNFMTNKKIKAAVDKNQKGYVDPNQQQQEEEFVPVLYYFKSYADAQGETFWAAGTVETTNVEENGYTKVKVITNDIESFVNQEFYISSSANADGTTLYPLYSDAGTTTADIYVKISETEFEEEPEKEPEEEASEQGTFIIGLNITHNNTMFDVSEENLTYTENLDVDWGDGSQHENPVNIDHTYNTGVYSVTITGNITAIKENWIGDNINEITSLNFPSTLTEIEAWGIAGVMVNCEYIAFNTAVPPTVGEYGLYGLPSSGCNIYVPVGSLSAYTSAENYPDPEVFTYIEGTPQ